jgi:hypothetical protein
MTTDERLLSTDAATAVINAPIARVDIADWLFLLPDAEYQRCAPGQHIAAGVTTTDDGRPMSINVEQIAGTSWSSTTYPRSSSPTTACWCPRPT